MKQISMQKFESENGKINLLCNSDTALGDLHDFLLSIKGNIVERMVKAQKEEEANSENQKKVDSEKEEK